LGLSGEPGEEYGPIREDWGCDGAEMRLGKREWEGREQR